MFYFLKLALKHQKTINQFFFVKYPFLPVNKNAKQTKFINFNKTDQQSKTLSLYFPCSSSRIFVFQILTLTNNVVLLPSSFPQTHYITRRPCHPNPDPQMFPVHLEHQVFHCPVSQVVCDVRYWDLDFSN